MIKPDYRNGSIVNLMSSIGKACGSRMIYKSLPQLKPKELSKSKNIILIVIDGLGYDYLQLHGKKTFLMENLKGKITSVFPPTTAAAMTTFYTGTAPQQHAITGWFMFLKELGVVARPLPFDPRCGGPPFRDINPKTVFTEKSFFDKINRLSYIITHEDFVNSDYSKATGGNAKRIAYSNMSGMFRQIKSTMNRNKRKKFIHVYWPKLDSLMHEHGTKSPDAKTHFLEIDRRLREFSKGLKDTTIIITADHGLTDIDAKNTIFLKDHKGLESMLALPLCGEMRAAYCYVKPSGAKDFEKYVRNKFGKKCILIKTEELIRRGYFGLYKPNKKLKDRSGDYVILMKGKYGIKDYLPNEKKEPMKGHHGGLSSEEMFVPLVVFRN